MENNVTFYRLRSVVAVTLLMSNSFLASANENISGAPSGDSTASTENASDLIPPSGRFLEDLNQLTMSLQEQYKDSLEEAVGTGGHPFTTKRASGDGTISPLEEYPWRPTGKLHMTFGSERFVCTASVIGKNLLVTAAHCVHNFGQETGGFADALQFEPARHELSRPFGSWRAKQWWIPKAYFEGTDNCSTNSPGVVCENDVAVVVLENNEESSIEAVTGKYHVNDGSGDDGIPGYGFVKFLDKVGNQITQLGYPSSNYDGDKMIRTDSFGFLDSPSNIIIGSNQTGGSSGGPWLANFGAPTSSFTGSPSVFNESNQVVGVTSWGFTSDEVKIQGASMFSTNSIYTEKSNIQSLIDSACAANPDDC